MSAHGDQGPRPRKARAVVRTRPPGAALPQPPQPGPGFDRTAGLVHELGNLLDGSMRQVNLALRSLDSATALHTGQADLDRRLRIVRTALEHMAGLIGAASRPPEEAPGADRFGGITMAEAARHAASILEPEAAEHKVRITATIDPRLEERPARGTYCVMLNALRNALDACRSAHGSRIDLHAAIVNSGEGQEVMVEVRDDGPGPRDAATLARAFEPGFTTKRSHAGLGLALARDVVRDLGGCVALRCGDGGVGAVFEARWPAPEGRQGR